MKEFLVNTGSRFASNDEILRVTQKSNIKNVKSGGLVVSGDGEELHLLGEDVHNLITGMTGAKKNRLCVWPQLLTLIKAGESVIVNDPKGENYKRFSGLLDKEGYKKIVLNFANPESGDQWDPMEIPAKLYRNGDLSTAGTYLRDVAEIVYSRVKASAKDAYWPDSAINFFVGISQMLMKETKGKAVTLEMIQFNGMAGMESFGARSSYLKAYLEEISPTDDIYYNLHPTVYNAPDTRDCIVSSFNQPLNSYTTVRNMICKSSFDMTEIGRKKTAVFLITPPERSAFDPIIAAFVKQVYQVLVDQVARKTPNCRLPLRVNFILDEFCNLPQIPDFSRMLSLARGMNIRFSLVIQSLSQLQSVYGKDLSLEIINDTFAMVVLRNRDPQLHEMIRALCGKQRYEHTGLEFDLVTPEMLQTLDKSTGEALILLQGERPFITHLPDIDQYGVGDILTKEVHVIPRKKVKRPYFDIRSHIKEKKREQFMNMANMKGE